MPDDFADDHQRRNLNKIPPGYKDGGKDDGGPGDLLIWNTILHVGRSSKKHVMFVTGEKKTDWWHKASDGPLYPRFELVEEFRRASDGKTFHIVSFAELLESSGADADTVEEVRREQVAVAPSARRHVSRRREAALTGVYNWLLGKGSLVVNENSGFADFWLFADDAPTAVIVRLVGLADRLASKLNNAQHVTQELREKEEGTALVVFVALDHSAARRAEAVLLPHVRGLLVRPQRFEIVVGFVEGHRFLQTAHFISEQPS